MYTIAEIEIEAARRIEALDAARWRQGTTAHTWHESTTPLTTTQASVLTGHLLFSASVEDTPVTSDAGWDGDGVLGVQADLRVIFVYRCRAGDQRDDQRLAAAAAVQILGALLAPWPQVTVIPTNAYRPGKLVENDGFLPVEVRASILFDLSV